MATKDDDITRSHELYIRHISLLGKAVPLALKTVITKIEGKHGKTLDSILKEKKDTIKTFYYDLFQALFKEDEESFNTQIGSWGLSTLCGVIFVLSESSELDCVSCISGQLRDVEKYTHSASLEYNTYRQKWESLCESLLKLVKGSKAEYECKRLIHLYDESRAIEVSEEVIKELKRTEDVDKHILVAISSEFALDGQSETKDDPLRETGEKIDYNDTCIAGQKTEFIQPLSDIVVHEDDLVVLSCELNTIGSQAEWRKNDEPLLETKTVKVLADKSYHWLVFARAIPENTGKYSCIYNNVSTSAYVKVSKQDFMVVKALHIDVDGQVKENRDVSLVCTVNAHTKNPKWFHNNKEITQSSRVVVVSEGLEYKLIIRNVQFEDDGLYVVAFGRVTSCTTMTVKGETNQLVKEQLSGKLFSSWARTSRNEILHNANYELSEDQLHEYLDNFKDVLEAKNNASEVVLANDESVKEALNAFEKLKTHQTDIRTSEEIQNLKEHAMKEAADILKEAQKQKDEEFPHMKEQLKKAEKELQLLRRLKTAFQRNKV